MNIKPVHAALYVNTQTNANGSEQNKPKGQSLATTDVVIHE